MIFILNIIKNLLQITKNFNIYNKYSNSNYFKKS